MECQCCADNYTQEFEHSEYAPDGWLHLIDGHPCYDPEKVACTTSRPCMHGAVCYPRWSCITCNSLLQQESVHAESCLRVLGYNAMQLDPRHT